MRHSKLNTNKKSKISATEMRMELYFHMTKVPYKDSLWPLQNTYQPRSVSSLSLSNIIYESPYIWHITHQFCDAFTSSSYRRKKKCTELSESQLTLQPQPYMRVNADSEWERQCGRERGRENLACWEDGGGKLLSSWVYDACAWALEGSWES